MDYINGWLIEYNNLGEVTELRKVEETKFQLIVPPFYFSKYLAVIKLS